MTAVSAPGKVLLAGGYLVLDRAYTGLVFGLSARIHVVVRDAAHPEIVVESPQFRDASWAYSYHVAGEEGGVDVIQVPGYENRAASSFLRLTSVLLHSRCPSPSLSEWFSEMVTCSTPHLPPFRMTSSSESGQELTPYIPISLCCSANPNPVPRRPRHAIHSWKQPWATL